MLMTAVSTLNAQNFSVTLKNGGKLFLHITDSINRTVSVVRPVAFVGSNANLPVGALDIPASVTFKDTVYRVTGIGERAFSNIDGLTFVAIPSSITSIGEKAFEGCTALEGVVFPAASPAIGKGAFDGTSRLSSVSFGSDWQSVDFGMFSSSALETVIIPAKVKKITNMKAVESLKQIIVDGNNPAFSSKYGMLYSKDGKTLFTCPVGKAGVVEVAEGVEKILEGAFKDCGKVTEVILPSTIREFAYNEFVECKGMYSLTILSEMPPVTAKFNGTSVFALRLADIMTNVYVNGSSQSLYKTAICSKAGIYESLPGTRKDNISEGDLISKQSIMKIKK